MNNQSLIDALEIIVRATEIPDHKKDDIRFLLSSLSIAHVHAKAVLEHDKEIRNPIRDTTGDDHTT